MPREVMHAVEIHAEPHTLFEAITTQRGQTAFWTADAVVEPRVGSVAEVGFPPTPARLKMLVERLEPDHLVAWLCQGDSPYWSGTRLIWEIRPGRNAGETTLLFTHTGWAADYPTDEFAHVNFVWGQIVAHLKAYAESGRPQPVFPAAMVSP
jgi:uncharacterized protein YndB with AHSA1/START domain